MAHVALDPTGATRAIAGKEMGSGSRENVQQKVWLTLLLLDWAYDASGWGARTRTWILSFKG